MNKTKIPWADYTINPVKGLCPMACDYCYARRMYKRFKWNPEIRYEPEVYYGLPEEPSRIFVGSTMELFGDWIDCNWLHMIFTKAIARPQHTFIFLTKQPQNLIKRSPFPPNCWIGATVTNHEQLIKAQCGLANIEAQVKFVSVEPMLPELDELPEGYWLGLTEVINWIILGARTQPTKYPKPETVKLAIECADYNHIPVFVKEPMASYMNIQRQEFPKSGV